MARAVLITYKIKKNLGRFFTRRLLGFYSGTIISYFAANFFAGRETEQPGIVPSVILNLGDLNIHLHHWLLSSILLVLVILPLYLKGRINQPLFFFTTGFFLGLIIQGVFSYSDWNDIVNRNIHLIEPRYH